MPWVILRLSGLSPEELTIKKIWGRRPDEGSGVVRTKVAGRFCSWQRKRRPDEDWVSSRRR